MIDIDDNVPLPQPDKPDTWVSVSTPSVKGDGWVKARIDAKCGTCGAVIEADRLTGTRCDCTSKPPVAIAQPTEYDGWEGKRAKACAGFVECYLVGGPLNGKRGPIKGDKKTVELEVYDAQGNVTSVELYTLGDNPTLTFRYHAGSKDHA